MAEPYFERDGITIYHGDCRDILPQLEPVDLVITDPPYAIGGAKAEWKVTASVGTGIHYAAKKVNKGGAMLCFTTTSGRGMEFTTGAIGGALPLNRLLVWHKEFVRSRVAGPWRWDAVAILAFGARIVRPGHILVRLPTTGDAARARSTPATAPTAARGRPLALRPLRGVHRARPLRRLRHAAHPGPSRRAPRYRDRDRGGALRAHGAAAPTGRVRLPRAGPVAVVERQSRF